jgi:hypothetical protein
VALGDGSVTYQGVCDGAGRYQLATASRLPAGSYTMFSGDGATGVSIGSTGVATANVQVFNPGSTAQPPNPYPIFLE